MERASRSSSKLSSRDRGYSSEYYSSTGSFSSTPEASDVAFNDPRLYTSNLVSEFDDTKSTLVSILEVSLNIFIIQGEFFILRHRKLYFLPIFYFKWEPLIFTYLPLFGGKIEFLIFNSIFHD